MKTYTGMEYLYIDLANNFGKDKLTFDERIQWAKENEHQWAELAEQADSYPLYEKARFAIQDAKEGKPIGHLVGMDAICSGAQIMSVLTGCESGCKATGAINTGLRPDAYSIVHKTMNSLLKNGVEVDRPSIKQAVMTMLYGSTKEPQILFGEDTPELEAFYQAVYEVLPGAYELLQTLIKSWNVGALEHVWTLPDGYLAKVKVMAKKETVIRVEELGNSSFTYQYKVNEGSNFGLSNAANVIHSIDAYILRSLVRRCSYDPKVVTEWNHKILEELMLGNEVTEPCKELDMYYSTGLVDLTVLQKPVSIIPKLPSEYLRKLYSILSMMLEYKPFPVVTIHDQFSAHPNNVNWVRYWYKEILADLADSTILDHILSQLYKTSIKYPKKSQNISQLISESEYAIC